MTPHPKLCNFGQECVCKRRSPDPSPTAPSSLLLQTLSYQTLLPQNPNPFKSLINPKNFSVAQSLNENASGSRIGALVPPPILEKLEKIDVNPLKGTRDFPPEEMRLRSWIFHNFREVSRLFGFEEVDYPVLESEALFIRKAGEEIRDQLYSFEDRGNRRVALRPELTPLARVVIPKGYWLRQSLFLLSSPFPSDLGLLHKMWALKYQVKRCKQVLQEVLQCYSIPEHLFGKVCVIIDKMEKIPLEEIKTELGSAGVSEKAIVDLLQVMSVKSLSELEEKLGSAGDAILELKQLFSLADKFGYSEWIQFDASVVRGLAYYTGVVFEVIFLVLLSSFFI
ncbi:hypothetical protein GIB67_032206 [Kingdonia uniflora]|uniref:histidine--tRNA ligase n=1 Tax=Kingdonia uniflora TaxID=39325 RepID=A0A7J7MWY6_9MAGN|nr:hypothetical protein GIB67_032206 [Kingdonia uniflora]